MEKLDRYSGAFWFVVSVCVSIQAYRLGLGDIHNPGVGFFFFWSGVVMGLLSIILLAKAVLARSRGKEEPHERVFKGVKWVKVGMVLAATVIYGIVFEWLGFLLSTVLFMAFLLRSIEAKRWIVVAFVAITSSILAYVLFEVLLKSRLPKGLLGF